MISGKSMSSIHKTALVDTLIIANTMALVPIILNHSN